VKNQAITVVAAAALACLLPSFAAAQKPVTKGEMLEVKAKIVAIDSTSRLVTLQDDTGESETIYAGPEVKRFDELKVGDTVTFRYYESIVYSIKKPGAPASTAPADSSKVVRSQGPKPGGTISEQQTATVQVKAVDPKKASITVLTDDGRTVSFQVEDPRNLKGVAVGDKVEITYTTAVMITVK
jgi:Cu/Ag efflux protein CusF